MRNNKNNTLNCLAMLSKQSFSDFEVIVVDDGSNDGTTAAIEQRHPLTMIIQGDGNLWWTGAINEGLKLALEKASDEDYILTLNDDVTFQDDYLENLARAIILRPGWLIGSVSLDKDNTENINAGVYFDWKTRKIEKGKFKQGSHFNQKVNRLPGRGALIPVRVFRRIGLYDTHHFPHYAADSELAVRALNAGFKVCIYFGAVLESDTSVSGYKFTPFKKLTIKQAYELLFSNKSVHRIKTRFNFVLLHCPPRYRFRNILAEAIMVLQILTSIPPIWYMKRPLRPLIKNFQ